MPDPLWTSDEIVRATGGLLQGRTFAVSGVSFDSRSIGEGELFVALKGERDGHAFARAAFERGAEAALVSQPVDGPHIEVADTLVGLERLGVAARERARARRGAVTGSVGKTSVTQAVKAALELAGPAHGSVKSFNNQIGVPLTLARMPRQTRRAVFEIGMNHAGEIEPLSRMVRPHAVAVTTVGPVHTENFEAGGVAVLNADDHWFALLEAQALRAGAEVRAFGSTKGCDAQLLEFRPDAGGAMVRARRDGHVFEFPIAQTGVHWGLNSLCVLLLAEALDVQMHIAKQALAHFQPLDGRGSERRVAVDGGELVLIDESYNANPISMRAAMATLGARRGAGRRIVVLTDMLELGADGPRLHAELAGPIEAAKVDLVFCAGPLMKSLWDALPAARRGAYAAGADKLAPQVLEAVRPGDLVMVKGSHGSRAGLIAEKLAALAGRGADTVRGAA